MITPVARFVTRMQGKDDGLFFGSVFKAGKDNFKPNTVYEIVDILGTLTIVEVGQGVGAGSDNCVSNSMSEGKALFHWGQDIGNIISSYGKHMFLTFKEYMQLISGK